MVRLATEDDCEQLLRMGNEFFNVSKYSEFFEYNKKSTMETFSILIDCGCLFTDGEHGMIGFIVFPLFFNTAQTMAQELFWWVDKEKRGGTLGILLLKNAEKRAKELGASIMMMLALDGLKENSLGDGSS